MHGTIHSQETYQYLHVHVPSGKTVTYHAISSSDSLHYCHNCSATARLIQIYCQTHAGPILSSAYQFSNQYCKRRSCFNASELTETYDRNFFDSTIGMASPIPIIPQPPSSLYTHDDDFLTSVNRKISFSPILASRILRESSGCNRLRRKGLRVR